MTALSGRRAALRKGTSVVAAALLMLLASSPGRAQQHKATLSSILAPNHMITRAYQMFADKVAQKTNGAVAIKVAHSAQLGGIKETADDLIAGNLVDDHAGFLGGRQRCLFVLRVFPVVPGARLV
ncbi:MAG: Bacterial extracellular solute-binding protein family 7, partial [Ramlibacter sp.]|nr:Bacterial extracellular solute-binding protein family 7 [Ramlibacter sp.]